MDLFKLVARIVLDQSDYEKGLGEAEEKSVHFSDKLKSGFSAVGKVIAAAGITTAVAKIGQAAMSSFADYEQLAGGVETLFKGSADTVQAYADNAYQTAGLSANAYMETVTSFSASLLQSLDGDTAAAAEKADRAITDMSDNANKMGTDMQMIQNAYQGFAKQNYTMLDNLKLGYGGTKEEMERLLADAEKLSGVKYDISSYADIVDAIHVVQTEMGITGTTALEASSTISGSINAMKGAWENFLTGLVDGNQDLGVLFDNLLSSVITVGENVVPRIIALIPRMIEGLSMMITEGVPRLLEGGQQMLGEMTTGVENAVPDMVARLPLVIAAFLDFITGNLPAILSKGFELLGQFAFGILEGIPGMVGNLPAVIDAITNFVVANFPVILTKGGELLGQLVMGILGAVPQIALKLPAVITAIVNALKAGWTALNNAGSYLLEGLWSGISDKIGWLKSKVAGVVDKIKSWFTGSEGFDEHSPSRWSRQVFRYVLEGGGLGLDDSAPALLRRVAGVTQSVKDRLTLDPASVEFEASGMGRLAGGLRRAVSSAESFPGTIVVQSVLDGRVIGETAYRYGQNKARAYGG